MPWFSRYITARRRRKASEASMPMILDFMAWQTSLYRHPESPEEEVARVMEQMNRHRQNR
jgi:hypothetical protein